MSTAGAADRLHPQVRALLGVEAYATPPSLEALRAGYLQTALERGGAVELVDATEDVVIPRADGGSLRARVYTPLHGIRVEGRLVWLHGGGWCMGDIEGFDLVCRSLANAGGFEVVSVEYRLIPEDPFPAAVQDADAAVAWAMERGGRVVVGGDSAGANLATVAARHARDAVAAQVLVYPAVDASMSGASYAEDDMPMLTAEAMGLCWRAYGSTTPPDDPDLSPLYADLAGVPAAFVVVAGVDVLRSDGEAYAAALRAAGVDVEFESYDGMSHGFLRWGGVVDTARDLIANIAAFTAARL